MGERRSRAEWSRLVAALTTSGLPVRAFASRAGVSARSLSWWRWRIGARGVRLRPAPPEAEGGLGTAPGSGAFIELARPPAAAPNEAPGGAGVRVELGSTCRIAFSAMPPPAYLAALVRAYEVGP